MQTADVLTGGVRPVTSAHTSTAWAAPGEAGFMRQQPEAELRAQWKEGRKDARLAYRKLHEDTMRQRRKDVDSGRARRGRDRDRV